MQNMVDLTDAALRLRISWERAWRAVLDGRLQGQKRNGKWLVSEESIVEYAKRQAEIRARKGGDAFERS